MGDEEDGATVFLHSSWRGIVAAYAGAVLLIALAVGGIFTAGWNWITGTLLVAGITAAAVVLLDLPIAAAFDGHGVTRRALLRHHRLEWGRVRRLRRQRVGVVRTRRGGVHGGLVAEVGRRTYLLVDVMENGYEFDRLLVVLGPEAERLGLGPDTRPPDDHPPTWSLRRGHWRSFD